MGEPIEITTVPGRTVAVKRFHLGAEEMGAMGERMGDAFGAVTANAGGPA